MDKINRELCQQYAKDNVSDLSEEILEWRSTALLRDGKLRELARMVSVWAGTTHDLQIAESMVVSEALEAAAA